MTFPLQFRKIIRGVKGHVDSGLLPATDYVANYEPIYAPFGGTIYNFKESKGGNWIGIKRDNGDKVEMAHLSKYFVKQGWFTQTKVKEGQIIAISGNTGTETSGPHLHLQVIVAGERVDPEEYFTPKSLPVMAVNLTIPQMHIFQQEILKYSAGMWTINWNIIKHPIDGPLDQFGAYDLAEKFYNDKYRPYRYLFINYTPVQGENIMATFYYPKRNMCITKMPMFDARLCTFEFAHQLGIFFSANRGNNPFLDIEDALSSVTDEMICRKLRAVLPYTSILV